MNPRLLIPVIMLLLALTSSYTRAGQHCGHHEPERPSAHTHAAVFGDSVHDHDQVTLCAPEDAPCDHHCCEMHHGAPISVSVTTLQHHDDRPHDPMPWRSIPSLCPRAPPISSNAQPDSIRLDDRLVHTQTIVLLN